MAVTQRLLEINPEVFTAWNFRREAIVTLSQHAKEHREKAEAEQTAAVVPAATAAALAAALAAASEARAAGSPGSDAALEAPAATTPTAAAAVPVPAPAAAAAPAPAAPAAPAPGPAPAAPACAVPDPAPPPPPPPLPHDPPYVPPLEAELTLTYKTLTKNPKSYPSWHHRKWTVQRAVHEAGAYTRYFFSST